MANKIVGRLKEQETLREAYESKRPEFIAIYGRRRIGKTYLIHNYPADSKAYTWRYIPKNDIEKWGPN